MVTEKTMRHVIAALARIAREDAGQDMMEYGLLAALIAIGAFTAVGMAGNAINNILWQYIVSTM
jgi:Flp pilus assembly pilin Flp